MEITGAFIPDLEKITNETEMNNLMTRFVLEVRRKDGNTYIVSTQIPLPAVRGSVKASA